jgi:hypothetical protein
MYYIVSYLYVYRIYTPCHVNNVHTRATFNKLEELRLGFSLTYNEYYL